MSENLGGKGGDFWAAGVAAPFVASLPAAGSGAPASLCRGGCDRVVVAAPSIPLGLRSLHHGSGHSMAPAPTLSLIDGG